MSVALLRIPANDTDQTVTWEPENDCIPLRDGRAVDVSGHTWTVHTPANRFDIQWKGLNLPQGNLYNAARRWIAHLLRTQAASVGAAGFRQASHLFATPAFIKAAETGEDVPYLAFSQAQTALGREQRWQLHYARLFYRWCVSQRFPQFSPEVARKLDDVVIGGNRKGEAVRSADPDKGPLDAMEVATLALALRAARLQGTMPLEEQAAAWLALAFGANAEQYAMMREEDIEPQHVADQLVTTLINVPRHKKGHEKARAAFQTRKANRFIGKLLLDLVKQNREPHPTEDGTARPLFRRSEPLNRGKGLEEWAWHLDSKAFTRLLQRAIKRLRVQSRSGSLLQISTRRLRYSMASRMVQEGASKYAVAAALDHTDLQNVDTYFDVHSGILDHIDRAVALVLGARAYGFATLVEKEDDAVNGDNPASRRFFGDRKKDIFEPIGTCGHNFLCNVGAPYACYVCPKFQAWMDGPHDLVLDALIESRTRREELGLDPRIIAVEDELIVHVASIINRIGEMRQQLEMAA